MNAVTSFARISDMPETSDDIGKDRIRRLQHRDPCRLPAPILDIGLPRPSIGMGSAARQTTASHDAAEQPLLDAKGYASGAD